MGRTRRIPLVAAAFCCALVTRSLGASQQVPPRDRPAQSDSLSASGEISGRVLTADTGKPVKRARVSVSAPEYRCTVKQWEGTTCDQLVQRCARLIGPSASEALDWLRRAPLDGGVGAELVDESGRATGNGGDAALSGMVAYMAWYAVHALGAKL